jgi:hypothetical protein
MELDPQQVQLEAIPQTVSLSLPTFINLSTSVNLPTLNIELFQPLTEFKKDIENTQKLESSNRYVSSIIIEICEKLLLVIEENKTMKYVHYFNELENNYVLKRVKDSLKEKFPYCIFELDSEKKFVSIEWNYGVALVSYQN